MAVLPKVRSALCAASQLPGETHTDVEDVSAPARQSKPDDDDADDDDDDCKPGPFMTTFCAEGHHFLKAHIEHTVSRKAKKYNILQMKGSTMATVFRCPVMLVYHHPNF